MTRGSQHAVRSGALRQSSSEAGVMAYRRGGPGNHARLSQDKYEREADQAASRILRGESGVARLLTPAPAASFRMSSSMGRPLSLPLRTELEQAFGADLSVVRVHSGSAAAAAARAEQAAAFASGPDLYFDEGRYQPGSESGRRLLLHELAHVLQQTGRRGSDGRMFATSISGAGEIQLDQKKDPPPVTIEDQLKQLKQMQAPEPAQVRATLKGVASRHRDAGDADDDSKAHCTSVEELVDKAAGVNEIVDGLIAATEDSTFPTTSEPTVRLYFDCFKVLGRFDKAMALVGDDVDSIPANTAAPLIAFYLDKMRGQGQSVAETLKANAVAARYWKKSVIDSFRIVFYGLIRVAQDLDPQGAFRTNMTQELVRVLTETPLAQNERVAVAIMAFRDFNLVRISELTRQPDAPGKTPTFFALVQERIAEIELLAEGGRLKKRAQDNKLSPEVIDLCEEIDADLIPVAKEASDFWSRVRARVQQLSSGRGEAPAGLDEETLAARQADLGATVSTIKSLRGLEARLKGVARTALRLGPGGKLPSEAGYRGNLSVAHKELASATFTYDQGLIAIQRDLWSARDLPADKRTNVAERVETWRTQAEAYGVVLWLVFAIDSELLSFDAAPRTGADGKATEIEKRSRADRVLRHFRYLAIRFFQMGAVLGYSELQAEAAQIARAETPGLTQSYVGLFGSFAPMPTTFEEFTTFFPRATISGLEPLTGSDIVMLVYDLYYTALADRLEEILKATNAEGKQRREVFDPNLKPIVNEAVDSLKGFEPPHRFRMPIEDVELYIRPQDAEDISKAVSKHPLYESFRDSTLREGELAVVPGDLQDHMRANGVVVWFIPNVKSVVFTIAAIPHLTEAKLKGGKLLGEPTDENWATWLLNLKNLEGGPEQWSDAIFQAIKKSMEQAWRTLADPLRDASINLRRSRVPQIIEGWQKYDRHNVLHFGIPNALIQRTLGLGASLQPVTENKRHVTALLLELAPVMHKNLAPQGGVLAWHGTDRLDLILLLLPHLTGATELLKDQAEADKVKKLNLMFPESEFLARATQLREMRAHFETVQLAHQEDVQLGGNASKQSLFVPGGGGYPIVVDAEDGTDIFTTEEGIRYELIHVHSTFTYVPPMAVPSSAIAWPESQIGKSELFDSAGQAIDTDRDQVKLFDIKRNAKVITVTGADDRLLAEITYAVHMERVRRQLADLAEYIEGLGELITLGLQVAFPEAAAPIAYAEIAATALRFFTSSDFDEVKRGLEGDTAEMLKKLWDSVKTDFAVHLLWDYLLFDRDIFAPIRILTPVAGALKREKDVNRQGRRPESKSNVARIFGRLKNVGEGVGHAFVALHDRVNVPVRHTQLFVLDHPVVALVLRAIARNLYQLESLRLNNLQEDVTDLAQETVFGRVGDFLRKVDDIFARLDELELPKEIVPLDLILELVTGLIIDRLPMKYRFPIKTFQIGLKTASPKAYHHFFTMVATEVKHQGFDPNLIWQKTIRSELEPHFEDAVRKVSKELNDLVTAVPFLKQVQQVVAPGVNLRIAGDEFPSRQDDEEAQPMPRAGVTPTAPSAWHLPSDGSGRPLGASALADSSRRLGHDFSHVRLHGDDGARRVTDQFQADAITSGSHIFMRPDLMPQRTADRRVLYHELGHVVQQTGPRPVGRNYSAQDSWGRPHRGLTFEPSLEAEANRMASAASRQGREGSAPYSDAADIGIQPSLTDVVGRFFSELGNPRMVKEHAKSIEKKGTKDQRGWPQEAKDLADERTGRSIGTMLIDALRGKGTVKAKFDAPFNAGSLPQLIADHLESKETLNFSKVIGQLVKKTLVPLKKDDKTAERGAVRFSFDPKTFMFELRDYLLGKTGVLLDITPKLEAGAGTTKGLNASDPFASITVSYLHLPLVGPVSGIWRTIIANTFPGLSDQERNVRQSKAWLVLLGLAPTPGVYSKKKVGAKEELVLSKMIVDKIEVSLQPKTALTADALPPWSDYIKPERVQPLDPKFGQIGLRLGTYVDRAAPDGLQYGQDRDAHHTVQFLLIEYLNNKKDVRPFRHALSLYPGVEGKGGIDRIGVIDANGKLTDDALGTKNPFGKQIPDRAPAMPTILLSRHAHRLGDVHITPKPDDTNEKQSTQGGAVHRMFRTNLGAYADMVTGSSDASLRAVKDRADGKTVAPGLGLVGKKAVTSLDVSKAIHSAVCATYKDIRDHMKTKLDRALGEHEAEYYESVVKTDTSGKKYNQTTKVIEDPAFVPDVGKLTAIKDKTAAKTIEVMHDAFGFPDK